MTFPHHFVLLPLCAAALLAACATHVDAPAPAVATVTQTAMDCAQLSTALAKAGEAQQAARARQQDAWKAVVPVAVAARYARSQSEADAAAQQLAALQGQAAERGCANEG